MTKILDNLEKQLELMKKELDNVKNKIETIKKGWTEEEIECAEEDCRIETGDHCRKFEGIYNVEIVYGSFETGVIIFISKEDNRVFETSIAAIEKWWYNDNDEDDGKLERFMEEYNND